MEPLRQLRLFMLILPVLPLLASCGGGKRQDLTHVTRPTDTLYTEQRAMDVYGREPERALAIIDSAELVGNISDFRASLCRAKVYGRSMELLRPDTAQAICEALLDHDSVKANANLQMEVIDQLINVCRLRQDNEQWLHWASTKAQLCREYAKTKPTSAERDQAETEALRAEAEIGVVLAHLGKSRESLEWLDRIITRLDRPGSLNRFDALIISLKRKINVLRDQHRYADIVSVASRMLDCLDYFTAHATAYAEDSDRLPDNAEDRACYIDFYRAQAHLFLAEAYKRLGDIQQARNNMARFEQSDFSHTFGGRRQAAIVRMALGEYDKALASFNEQEQQLKGDTVCDDYAVILKGRAEIAERQGRLASALDYRHRYEALSDTLHKRLLESQVNDYAARYHLREQRMNAKLLQARADRSRLINIVISTALFLVLAVLVWYWWQQRVISGKNHSLVQQIAEAIKYKRLYETASPTTEPEESEPVTESTDTPLDDILPSQVGADGASPDQLFERIHRIVKREKLYLNPVFDRQAVIDYFHLPKNRVGQVFTQGSDYNSLSDFIRDCRLEHACELLATTDMPISEIATASGFSRVTTFNHDFKMKYSVAPSIYRRHSRQ